MEERGGGRGERRAIGSYGRGKYSIGRGKRRYEIGGGLRALVSDIFFVRAAVLSEKFPDRLTLATLAAARTERRGGGPTKKCSSGAGRRRKGIGDFLCPSKS